MRRFLPFALPLSLFACNGASAPPAPEASASPSPTPLTDTATPPRPLALKRFGDWAVGCDNGGTCQAGSLMPEEGDAPALTLSIERGPGTDAPVAIRLRSQDDIALPLTATVDDEPVARGGTLQDDAIVLTGAPAMALAAKLASGRTLTLIAAGGRSITPVKLTGASAALRWIDDRQGRVGTTGAIVARGTKPDTRPAPPLPVVRAATIRGEAALLDPLLITRMRQQADCDDHDLPDVTTKTLDGPRTLAIVPCAAGAYNILSALFVIERGEAIPASFDMPVAGDSDGDLVYNATFEDGILDTFAKGRGLGDCGMTQRYAWDGTRFRLIEQRQMDDCRGNPDFIRTWTARVIR
ncbi:DUF1176 domain-containing protein [Sphingomonas sp. ABOLH]|uniref:DUF1176 domain-containing protein n=1 Tax=Sphingomonas sp. ABOLH TaxID=1985881 RepID=UPI000F7E8979|nr:DUF1176 domain-containing protein [Sphingomonas sp. ABOLH]RSV25007.1 DUF1176 domain-containing protein [Sphingomonas sp. ABOLH]